MGADHTWDTSTIYTSTLTLILYLATFSQADKVNSCIACTSEDGSNSDCEGTLEPESQPNVECSTEFGNDYCYVLVTKQKQPTQMWMWNRGCCTPKAGSQICPLSEPNHVTNEVYEMWRARCDTADCNLMDPRQGYETPVLLKKQFGKNEHIVTKCFHKFNIP